MTVTSPSLEAVVAAAFDRREAPVLHLAEDATSPRRGLP